MADYGEDVSTYPGGLDPTFTPITGPRVLVEQIARMLETPEGTHDDDPDFALLLANQINAPQTPTSVAVLAGKIVSKIESDDRVASATADPLFDPATRRLLIDVRIEPLEGQPLRFTLAIDAVTVSVLDGTF